MTIAEPLLRDVRHPTVARWSGRRVPLAAVLDAISKLRSAQAKTASRVSIGTVVVVSNDLKTGTGSALRLHRLRAGHPGRTVFVLCGPGEAGDPLRPFDAEVRLNELGREGVRIWWDEIVVVVRGEVCAHLDSVLRPLVLPELPVHLWWPTGLPRVDDASLAVATTVVVDSMALARLRPPRELLASLAALDRRCPVSDLAWEASTPARELLASCFDDDEARSLLGGEVRVEASGPAVLAELLAGWLAGTLRVGEGAVAIERRDSLELRLLANLAGRSGSFTVSTPSGASRLSERARMLRLEVELDGRPVRREEVNASDGPFDDPLARALVRAGREHAYGTAVRSAAVLAGREPGTA